MEIKAKLNYLRISPRKVRLVADLIRGMDVRGAELELQRRPKRSALPLIKLLKSAVANTKHNFQLSEEGLYIKKIVVNPGPLSKRFKPRAFGRAAPIRRRTSRVELILDSKAPAPAKKPKIKKKVEPLVREALPEEIGGEEAPRPKEERKVAALRPKPRDPGFVRRVFRRKAI